MSAVRRADVGWSLVLLLSLFAVAPLAAPGFFLTAHDATIGAYFLYQFHQGIADGALYPRWAMDWTYGYGYPLFIVMAPLAWYVAEAFHLLGAGMVPALKMAYALAFVASGLSMYLLGRELFGRAGGLVSAALYVYAPYHVADIYVRADLAEFAAFAFFPAILWAILRLSRAEQGAEVTRFTILGALLYGGLILTHITMAMLFTPVAALYAVFVAESEKRKAGRVFAAIAVAAAYLLPAVVEQHYIRAEQFTRDFFGYQNHYVYPFQLLSPFWGYGYAAVGPADEMSFQLGVVAVVLALVSLWALPAMEQQVRRQAIYFVLVTGVLIFAMLSASQPLWDLLRPVVAFIQFPWRLLSLTTVSLALVGGAMVTAGAAQRPAASTLILLIVLASYPYLVPQYTDSEVSLPRMIQFQLDTKEMLGDTRWAAEWPDGSPMVAEYLAGKPVTRAIADDSRAQIGVVHRGGASLEVRVVTPVQTDVLFHIRYYPGWRAYMDGRLVETAIRPPQGLMVVTVPAGEHTVRLRFEDTLLRLVAKLISLMSFMTALVVLAWANRR